MTTIKTCLLLLLSFAWIAVCQAQSNTFPPSGSVGIGTTSPTYDLDIRTAQPGIQLMESASGTRKRLQIKVGANNDIQFTSTYNTGGNYPFTFVFGGSVGEAMRIATNGNIGIGTTAPAEAFHVKGYSMFQRPDGANYIKIHSGISGNYITSDDPGTNQKNLIFQVVSSANENGGRHMLFQTGTDSETFQTRMIIRDNGNVGIGTGNPQAKLAVDGNILAKEVKVKADITVPDYVFEPDYELTSLKEIEAYVREYKHLPEVPSAAEVRRDGLDLANMNLLLLKKVEELTLHLIEKEKNEEVMQARLDRQDQLIHEISQKLNSL